MANTPGKARTCDLRFRKASLYPTELRGRSKDSLRLVWVFAKLGGGVSELLRDIEKLGPQAGRLKNIRRDPHNTV
jgi:hypothetical protein